MGRTRLHRFLLIITIASFAASQILLVRKVCVRREKHVKGSVLRSFQQVAVAQRVPPLRSYFFNGVCLQRTRNSSWHSVVKENEH